MATSYMPPKNRDGSFRDERSNTLGDAADFERHFNSHLHDKDDDWLESDYEDDEEEEDEDEDDCRCSDPGCPCSGNKRGGPP